MIPGQGLLHVVPVPMAMAYLLLRPLLSDVPEDELCGVAPGRVLPVNEKWHPHLMKGLCPVPAITAGDSVWWHCDLIHAVAPVENQQGWGNVMYIPAAPMCDKNRAYAHHVAHALKQGHSLRISHRSITKLTGRIALPWPTLTHSGNAACASPDKE